MRKLSEILMTMDLLEVQYALINDTMEDSEDKENQLQMISLTMDCLDTCLMYGDYINDTGKEFNYDEY
jgi:hypothetical protein